MFGATGHLPELIIILILGLVILGPGKLPQVGGAVGKTIREFRKASTETDGEESAPAADAKTATATAPVATIVTPPTVTVAPPVASVPAAAPSVTKQDRSEV